MSANLCSVSLKVSEELSSCVTGANRITGLAKVERAFVHVDYEHDHNTYEEHKPLYEKLESKPTMAKRIQQKLFSGRT
jgi:hypothetical protein